MFGRPRLSGAIPLGHKLRRTLVNPASIEEPRQHREYPRQGEGGEQAIEAHGQGRKGTGLLTELKGASRPDAMGGEPKGEADAGLVPYPRTGQEPGCKDGTDDAALLLADPRARSGRR